jgi:enediyne biosynthesis protein E4
MNGSSGWLRRQAVRLVALLVLAVFYGFARLPQLSTPERESLASRFVFHSAPLPELAGLAHRTLRQVSPSLEHIEGWISSVGAAVALADLDGDGLPNDLCHVDPRVDRVIVAPVPSTGERFRTFALDAAPLPYEAATMAPMGCLPGDYDEDGSTDLLVYYWGRTPVAFLRRPAQGEAAPPSRTAYHAVEVAPGGERWYTNAAIRADLDGDGHADLVIGNYFQDGARILDRRSTAPERMQETMSRAVNGGRNRMLLWSGAAAGGEPGVRFVEADALAPEVDHAWTLAIGAADLDGDLLPELYFGNDFGPDRLLHNRSLPGRPRFAVVEGRKRFIDPASKVLGHDSFKGMGVDFGDVNGDALLDIYVSNIAEEFGLEESHFLFASTGEPESLRRGVAPYVDRSEPLGLSRSSWGWDTRLADFDNDGVLEALQATGFLRGKVNRWPELHELAMGNDHMLGAPGSWPVFGPDDDLSGDDHNPFFVRARSGRYFDLAREVGLGTGHVSRGIATADVDGDGDLDFAVANQWEPSFFYRNDSPRMGASLQLDLRTTTVVASGEGVRPVVTALPAADAARAASWPAIGAAAIVHLPDGRRLVAQVDGGNGHSGKRSHELHFGLGRAAPGEPLPVDLTWRDAAGRVHRQTIRLAPGRHTLLLGGPQGKES